MTIFPSLWIVSVLTVLSNHPHNINPVSFDQSVLRRMILFTAIQLYVVNIPPTIIFPSLWMAMVLDSHPAPNQVQRKVSSLVPSALTRIILFAATQLYVVNCHPIIIFPSPCTATAFTANANPLQVVINVSSLVPSALRRIILFAAIQLHVVKAPPATILPSLWTAKVFIEPLNPLQTLKLASLVPSVLRRIILFAVTPLYDTKYPPTIIFPSLCKAKV
jgi:hypothetical protein